MQKILVILFFTLGIGSLKIANGQVPDTLRYLRQIVANKNIYINQPFSKLEDSLRISIQGFTPLNPLNENSLENKNIFRFIYSPNPQDMSSSFPWLIVVWETMPSFQVTRRLYHLYQKGQYSTDASQYYRQFIIKDIYLRE